MNGTGFIAYGLTASSGSLQGTSRYREAIDLTVASGPCGPSNNSEDNAGSGGASDGRDANRGANAPMGKVPPGGLDVRAEVLELVRFGTAVRCAALEGEFIAHKKCSRGVSLDRAVRIAADPNAERATLRGRRRRAVCLVRAVSAGLTTLAATHQTGTADRRGRNLRSNGKQMSGPHNSLIWQYRAIVLSADSKRSCSPCSWSARVSPPMHYDKISQKRSPALGGMNCCRLAAIFAAERSAHSRSQRSAESTKPRSGATF